MIPRLGIDIGGVIIARIPQGGGKDDTSFFSNRYLETPANFGALSIISVLVKRFRPANTFVVSKCGENIQRKSLEWLEHQKFYELTGFLPENIRFCRKRPEKGPICDELHITHFIDDRIDCLQYMPNVPHRFLFGAGHYDPQPSITPVADWFELNKKIRV